MFNYRDNSNSIFISCESFHSFLLYFYARVSYFCSDLSEDCIKKVLIPFQKIRKFFDRTPQEINY